MRKRWPMRLYARWADGGATHLLSGNITVDRRYLNPGITTSQMVPEHQRPTYVGSKMDGKFFFAHSVK